MLQKTRPCLLEDIIENAQKETEEIAVSDRRSTSEKFDCFEAHLSQYDQVKMPLRHFFTPGLYTRQIFMPAGTLLTSKIHLTEHPFVISMGRVSVWSGIDGEPKEELCAPYIGITKPNTRRILFIHEDTIWTTFHVATETSVEEIEKRIILKHDDHVPFRLDVTTGEVVPKTAELTEPTKE